MALGDASTEVEAHLYVPANRCKIVSGGGCGRGRKAYRKEQIY